MFLLECEEHFGTKCLYEILNVKKDCNTTELKKAYYQQSIKWHPDKSSLNSENEETKKVHTIKFQLLNRAYSILSNNEQRKIYDETGCVDAENSEVNEDVLSSWRKMFKKVTKEDIDAFMKEYEGSEEQEADIIKNYNKFNGDMAKIRESVIGLENYECLKQKIEALIKNGVIKETKRYKTSTSKNQEKIRMKRAEKEAKEAERILKNMSDQQGSTSLEAMILAKNTKRASEMNDFFDSLAAKYSQKKIKKK